MSRSPAHTTPPTYERRLILFIDFLGFKEVVASTESDPDALRRLIAALDEIGQLGEADIFESQRVTQFSDSVVMSYRVTERSAVFWMLNAIALTVVSLAGRGFLLRGAVTIGDLYHSDSHVVGPAMVRAYEMESQLARFPRVIVDPDLIALARQHRNQDHTPDDEEDYVRHFIGEDEDGQLFIDYISWNAVVAVAGGEDELYPDYLAEIGQLLEAGLAHDDPRVGEKYLWLYPRYIAAIDLVASLPADSPYRQENPENCKAMVGLPRFTELAAGCQLRVQQYQSERAQE